jgi:hypothetical protein
MGRGHENDTTFVKLPLSENDQNIIAGMVENNTLDVLNLLSAVVYDGYKLSITPHKGGESFIAALTGRTPENPNEGFTMSAFGPSPLAAVAAVLYKHFDICGGRRWCDEPFTTRQQLSLFG